MFIPLRLAIFLLLAGRIVADGAGKNLVPEVCAQSKNQDLCLSSLNADPNTKTANLSGLTLISIRIATSNATDTATFIRKNLDNGDKLDPMVQQAFADCADNYEDVVEQLDSSLAALHVRNYADLREWVEIAAADADSCEDSFAAISKDPFGMIPRCKTVKQLCENALTIIGILEKNRQ